MISRHIGRNALLRTGFDGKLLVVRNLSALTWKLLSPIHASALRVRLSSVKPTESAWGLFFQGGGGGGKKR